jgi:hypothetical protein
VPAGAFSQVLAEVAEASEPGADLAGLPEAAALLLGQYLSALDILTAGEEEELHLTMLRGAVALGHRDVVFKPHPSAPAHWSRRLEEEADALGAKLTVLDSPVLAEVLYERLRPAIVIGCFSTALLTASAFYGIPVARTGTGLLLDRLSPYQNSNRIPVTLVDALIPDVADPGAPAAVQPDLNPLLRAVGYCMQSHSYPHLRDEAVAFLAAGLDNDSWRYFKRRRLTALALPGAVPAPLAFIPRSPAVRRIARRALALKRAALG